MPTITLNFSNALNVSLQSSVGDNVFYQTANSTNIIKIGSCTAISGNSITCNIDNTTSPPANGDFIFFAKNNNVNLSSVLGYYNSVILRNNSTTKAELFAISCDVVESSK